MWWDPSWLSLVMKETSAHPSLFVDYSFLLGHSIKSHIGPSSCLYSEDNEDGGGAGGLPLIPLLQRSLTAFSTLEEGTYLVHTIKNFDFWIMLLILCPLCLLTLIH